MFEIFLGSSSDLPQAFLQAFFAEILPPAFLEELSRNPQKPQV